MAIEPPNPHYEAQNTLGQMYYHGEGMRANMKQARRLLHLAADQGQTDAQILCGDMLYRGEGGPVDKEEAFRLYSRAADADPPEPDAHHALGCMYYNGEGEGGRGPPTPERFARARQLLGMAASENHHEAQTMLAHMHQNGEGGDVDLPEAKRLYGLAAVQGHAGAQVRRAL
jgi:TPR repeat protein